MEPLYKEKTYEEMIDPIINYSGDNPFVKSQIYSMAAGGDQYEYKKNYNAYKQALEAAKANDNDNFWSGIGDFFVGKDTARQKADLADQFIEAYANNPFVFDTGAYNEANKNIKSDYDLDRGTFINGGILGALINPITQTAKAGVDLASGIGGNWEDWNKRDHLSDLGALGTTALTLSGVGNLASGASLGAKMGIGALNGALGNAAYNLYENGQNTNAGNLLGDAAFGAAFGAALPAAGNALGKITNRGAQRIVDTGMRNAGVNLSDDLYNAAVNQAKSGLRGKATSFGAGLIPNTRLGKIATIGGGTALGGFGLSNLLNSGNQSDTSNADALYNYYMTGAY